MGVAKHGLGGVRGGGGKLAFNPTGLSRDGLAPWEVKVLPSAEVSQEQRSRRACVVWCAAIQLPACTYSIGFITN